MNPDGISYLDLGDALLGGDAGAGLNGHWSPLYPALLGGALRMLAPSPTLEFPAVHLVNLVVFGAGLACCDRLVREILAARAPSGREARQCALPGASITGFAYALFLWTALVQIKLVLVAPDLLVAAFVFLLASQVVRIHRKPESRRERILLGALLGLAYLAKAPMLPIAVAFLAATVRTDAPFRAQRGALATSILALSAIALPYVVALSIENERPTFGESGRLNYAWHIQGVRPYTHWRGEDGRSGSPLHPTRLALETPRIYEFAEPIGGTYPPWTDPTWWHAGLELRPDWAGHARAMAKSARAYAKLFGELAPVAVGLLAFAALGALDLGSPRRTPIPWKLLLVGLAGLALYVPILVTSRYASPFVALVLLAPLCALRTPQARSRRRAATAVAIAAVGVSLARVPYGMRGLFGEPGERARTEWSFHTRVAAALAQGGVEAGSRVAILGTGYRDYWARIGRYRIVAEAPQPDAPGFWRADPASQRRALEAFAAAGASVLVARDLPPEAQGWTWIRGSPYAFILLGPEAARPTSP